MEYRESVRISRGMEVWRQVSRARIMAWKDNMRERRRRRRRPGGEIGDLWTEDPGLKDNLQATPHGCWSEAYPAGVQPSC